MDKKTIYEWFSDYNCFEHKKLLKLRIKFLILFCTTSEFNKLTAEYFIARLKQANLKTKTDFDKKLRSFNRKFTSNKTKYLKV